MRRVWALIAGAVAVLIVVASASFVGLYLAADDGPTVPATVMDDPDLLDGAPASDHPLAGYFCDADPRTGHLPHWRLGSTANAAVQQAITPDGTIDLGFERGLGDYPGRVLLVAGACNQIIGAEHQREHHLGLFRDARLLVIDHAGHTLIGERPQQVLPAFREFLAPE